MIIYKEFSSIVEDLGFSARTLYSVSNNIKKHYHTVNIPKNSGGTRTLHVPDELLKCIQRKINEKLLCLEPVSHYATAYMPFGSTIINASAHVGNKAVLKLDIERFFDNITYPVVKEKVFTAERYSEQNRVLLSMLCVYYDYIAQGAPTSPAISNIIMREFDNEVGEWCENKNIKYTRYCDDMTFSGNFDAKEIISFVKSKLWKNGFRLNGKKTVFITNGQRKCVTGIIVNEKLSIPLEYKKKLRQDIYYCKKFGVNAHLDKCGINKDRKKYLQILAGKVNYILGVEPQNEEMKNYKMWLKNQLKKPN